MANEDETRVRTDLDHFEVFPWNKNFEIGHATIDEQHQALAGLLNKLARTLVSDELIKVNSAYDELANYANLHFHDEEAIWSEYFADDSWFSSHQMEHSAFLPRVIELKEQDAGKPLTDFVENIVKFLIHWLAFHIIDNDKRMAMVVEAIESGASIEEAKVLTDKNMSGSMRILIETILNMYEGLSSRTIDLMREMHARIKAEEKLKEANKRLEELSITDQLTGLYNRRHFISVFQTEIRRARREKKALTYFLIDIDFFKQFNDNYGHLEGDTALKRVGGRLLETCRRPTDFAFRLGGEEFGVLATSLSNKNANEFGEILRASIEGLKIPHGYSEVNEHMTVSIGLINKVPSLDDTTEDFVRIADNRLYKAKELGRNRVVASD
jgi:diguanylate cyclase (GGDEF)-like protein/hemerythrin-like metal-binding protein